MRYSIITINYNNRDGLLRTIQSVARQTCEDYQFIVIDGGSTDGSRAVIEQHQEHIHYWVSEPDKGIYDAMNKGIAQARGDYSIFMNSGDCFHDEHVLQRVAAIGASEDVQTGDLLFSTGLLCISPEQVTMRDLYFRTLYHQASFIRTSLLKETPYDTTLKIAADWKFFFERIAIQGCSYRHLPLTVALFETGGISAGAQETIRQEQQSVIDQYLPKSVQRDLDTYIHGADDYDRFFMTVKHSRLKNTIYTLNVAAIKCVAPFLKLEWAKQFSTKLKA